jgi:aryl-alcohol dehydrogenase-like predicted oxidoreductase
MEYRKLGNSGLEVSTVGLGTNNFGRRLDFDGTQKVIDACIDQGVTFIDTANVYSAGQSEEYIGKALGSRRNQMVLTTKASGAMGEGPNRKGNSRKHLTEEIEASLTRLNTDYMDLFQVHFPDRSVPIEETLRALDDLVRQGKILYVGVSNFSAWETAEAVLTSRNFGLSPVISLQSDYSLLQRGVEKEIIPFCTAFNIGMIPYYPLASGFLTGKYKRGEALPDGTRLAGMPDGPYRNRFLNEGNFEVLEVLEDFAQQRGHTVLELAIGWLNSQPQVASVISGATKAEQVEQNAKAADWTLSESDLQDLETALKAA